MKVQIPKPKNWEDFEDLCHRLWRSMWGDPNACKNGRPGQAQHGVDVWGKPYYANKYNAVQCKLKNQSIGNALTIETVREEAGNAEYYAEEHGLGDLVVATTSNADSILQQKCRELDQSKSFSFPISIWNWDMIEDELNYRPEVYEEIYGKHIDIDEISELHIGRLDKDERIYLFFTRSIFNGKLSDSVRLLLCKFFIELNDNSMQHGHSTFVTIKFQNNEFVYTDDGIEFDILNLKYDGHGGHRTYSVLENIFQAELELKYCYEDSKNKLFLKFNDGAMLKEISPIEIVVPSNNSCVFSRQDIQIQVAEDIRRIKESTLPVKILFLPQTTISAGRSYLDIILETCKEHVDSVSLPSDALSSQLEDDCKRHGVHYSIR